MSSEAIEAVFNNFRELSTINTIKLARRTSIDTPAGLEEYAFSAPQVVQATEVSRYKKGTRIQIIERYMQNGYCYYRDDKGLVWRQRDIAPV